MNPFGYQAEQQLQITDLLVQNRKALPQQIFQGGEGPKIPPGGNGPRGVSDEATGDSLLPVGDGQDNLPILECPQVFGLLGLRSLNFRGVTETKSHQSTWRGSAFLRKQWRRLFRAYGQRFWLNRGASLQKGLANFGGLLGNGRVIKKQLHKLAQFDGRQEHYIKGFL